MSGPGEGQRYREAGKALALSAIAIALSSFLPVPLTAVVTFLAMWYSYSKLMFYGLFEGSAGRAKAFFVVATLASFLAVVTKSVGVLCGTALCFLYWVRLWK